MPIGAIAVAPSDPNVIYVGTGAGIIRPDLAVGDGVYKSTDAGKTWVHLRPPRHAEMIAMIRGIDPHESQPALRGRARAPCMVRTPSVGSFGRPDGGQTFEKVLYKDEYTSANDVRMDPRNPNILYAALWVQQQEFVEGGAFSRAPGGGVFKSVDGGKTWKAPLTEGLPARNRRSQQLGRGAASNPGVVYAAIAAAPTPTASPAGASAGGLSRGIPNVVGLYTTTDEGEHWQPAGTPANSAIDSAMKSPRTMTAVRCCGSAAATCRPSHGRPEERKRRVQARRSYSGEPRMVARRGPPCAGRPAATIIRRRGSIPTIRTSSSRSPTRAVWSPPIAASRGATGTRSRPRRCTTSRPTTRSRIGCVAASRTPGPRAWTAGRTTARSPFTTGIPSTSRSTASRRPILWTPTRSSPARVRTFRSTIERPARRRWWGPT